MTLAARGPVAIVTGASSGIGSELARQLAAMGLQVVAVGRRADRLEALASAVRATGGALHPLALDVTAELAPEQIRERAEALGPVTWLVNNAGVSIFGRFLERPMSEHRALLRLNSEALVALTHAVAPGMVARRAGRVLNVASVAGFMPVPFMATYAASKALVISFSEALREELAPSGVTVTAFCPGPTATEIYEVAAKGKPRKAPAHEMTAEACARSGRAAALRGVDVAVPGAQNWLNVMSARLAPRSWVRRLLRWQRLSFLGYPPDAFS